MSSLPSKSLMNNAEVMVTSAEGFETLMRIFLVRDMIEHRGFTVDEIAAETGLSRPYLTQALGGRLFVHKGYNLEHGVLDQVEDAISRLSRRRDMMCACSDSSRNHMRGILSMSEATRETFLDADAA